MEIISVKVITLVTIARTFRLVTVHRFSKVGKIVRAAGRDSVARVLGNAQQDGYLYPAEDVHTNGIGRPTV